MFSIQGNAPPVYDPAAGKLSPGNKVTPVTDVQKPGPADAPDRRRMPDRRIHSLAWNQPERRRRDRRAPLILSAQPSERKQANARKGRLLDIFV